MVSEGLLSGLLTVVECGEGVSLAYAGRLLAVMGARVIRLELTGQNHDTLRRAPPLLPSGVSALFEYLHVGKESVTLDLKMPTGQELFSELLDRADALLTDVPLEERTSLGLEASTVQARHSSLIYGSVLPFGASGPRKHWRGREITVLHSGGEGYLLPNGLSLDRFPDRPPVKIYGHFAEMQAGVSLALSMLAAVYGRDGDGQAIDIAQQDTNVLLSTMNLQRFGDGMLENRSGRSFRYGGVVACADGYVEILTLEDHQWQALKALMGRPAWAEALELTDPVRRGQLGHEINRHLRSWAATETVADIVTRAKELGVPVAAYLTPEEVLASGHERERGLFAPVGIGEGDAVDMLTAPFHVDGGSLPLRNPAPEPGQHNRKIWGAELGHSDGQLLEWKASGVI